VIRVNIDFSFSPGEGWIPMPAILDSERSRRRLNRLPIVLGISRLPCDQDGVQDAYGRGGVGNIVQECGCKPGLGRTWGICLYATVGLVKQWRFGQAWKLFGTHFPFGRYDVGRRGTL
jgi:hypothetical protein